MRHSTIGWAATVVTTAAILAGCGGSSKPSSGSSSTPSAPAVAQTTVRANANHHGNRAHRTNGTARPTRPTGTTGTTGQASGSGKRRAGQTKLQATVYRPAPSGGPGASAAPLRPSASAQNPCTFVTGPEAEAALHAQLARVLEAPLGPTCVFELKGHKPSITLAIQAIDVRRHLAQMKNKPTQLSVAGRTAYCGTLGSSLLYVPLGGGKTLQVVAPCAAAQALAAKALPRIKV
jgi:hypothetical protein